MGDRNFTSGERTGLIVMAIVLTAIVVFTSIDFHRNEPTIPSSSISDTTTATAHKEVTEMPHHSAKRRAAKKKTRKHHADPPRRNPRSERVDDGFADNAENN